MKNPELLAPLSTVRPEEDLAREPRWTALLDGAISEQEMATLEEEAQRSDEARRVFEAYRPLDRAAREEIVAAALAQIARPRPKPRPRPAGLIALLGGVAVALALWLIFSRPGPDPIQQSALVTMELSAETSTRGAALPGELPHLGPRSTFTATLRPSEAIAGPLEARAFLLRDGRARLWNAPIELAPGGAARITGSKEALFAGIGPGRWEVLVIVGRPGKLPGVDEAMALTPEQRRAGTKFYRAQSQEIELRDSRDP